MTDITDIQQAFVDDVNFANKYFECRRYALDSDVIKGTEVALSRVLSAALEGQIPSLLQVSIGASATKGKFRLVLQFNSGTHVTAGALHKVQLSDGEVEAYVAAAKRITANLFPALSGSISFEFVQVVAVTKADLESIDLTPLDEVEQLGIRAMIRAFDGDEEDDWDFGQVRVA